MYTFNKINLLSIKKIKDILSSNKDDIKNLEQSIKELQDEKQRNVEYENFSTFSSEFYSDEINPTKYGLNISPKENIEKIKKISENFIQNFDNPEEKNLLFTGDTRT